MAVVVIDKHGQRPFEMLRVHDHHPIKTFGSDSSDEPFRDPVGLRHLNWRANISGQSHLFEYTSHEGNEGMRNMLAAAVTRRRNRTSDVKRSR